MVVLQSGFDITATWEAMGPCKGQKPFTIIKNYLKSTFQIPIKTRKTNSKESCIKTSQNTTTQSG